MPDFGNYKIKSKLFRFWPIIFIFALWFLFACPYFLQGKVPYPSTYQVNHFAPWSHYEKFWGPVKNGAMPDIIDQIYPWRHFTIEEWKNYRIPFWNPYNFSGNPHLANYQSAVFSPFNLLFLFLPFIDAWSALILLQPLLAGLFMYLFVREIGISKVGSLISSISFMFCGFIVVWMAYGTLAFAILYLPLALFAIEKYFGTKRPKFLLLLALTIPLSFFSGHFQISFYFLATLIFYIFVKAFVLRNIQSTSRLLIAVILGLVITAPQLILSAQFYLHSVRSELFQMGEAIPLQYLITVFAPDFFGNPVTRNDWFGHYAEWASFIGIWPLFLAIYAPVRLRSWRVVFFLVVGISSLALAVNSPVSLFLVSLKIPVLATSALSRVIVLFSFSLAVLAGLGLDALYQDLKDKKEKKILITILVLTAVFLVSVWSMLLVDKVYPSEWLIVAKRNLILPTVLFGVGTFLLLVSCKKSVFIVLAIYYFLFAVSFDSLRFASKWMPFDPKELVFPDTKVINVINKHIGYGRIFGNVGAQISTYYRFPSIEGYDPLYIKRYGEFIRSAESGSFLNAERSVAKISRTGKFTNRILDLLGVTLIFHPIADTNTTWAYPVWKNPERFSLVFQDEKLQIFRNKEALKRAVPFYDYEVIVNKEDLLKRFYSEGFDFKNTLLLEEQPSFTPSKNRNDKAKVKIIDYQPNKILVEALTGYQALIFLSDNYYPGWKAYVNGKETKIYRANYTFKAVEIPKGSSKIEFIYFSSF